MSPELGFLLFLALLWGPTALWLVFRTIRGNRGRLPRPFDRSQLAPGELDAPVGSDGFWACGTCRSLNRSGASRCYRCRMAKGSAGRQAPGELPAGPGIPVMAEVIARPSGELPAGPGIPVMAEVIARPSGELPAGPGIPVMAEVIARPSGELPAGPGIPVMAEVIARPSGECRPAPILLMAEVIADPPAAPAAPDPGHGRGDRRPSGELPAGPGIPVMAEGVARPSGELPVATTVALATRGNGPPAPEILVGAPEHVSSAAPPEPAVGVPVCPFLGFWDGPAARFDFPAPGHFCHATAGRSATPLAFLRRFVPGMAGTGQPQPIAAEHQKSWCLAAAHQRCARYPAGRGGRDEPTVGREGPPSA